MSDEQWTLLLCPFCYGSAFIGFWCSEDGVTQEWRGECSVCGAHGPWRVVKDGATTAWNTRAIPDLRPLVAELVEALVGIDTFAWSAMKADCEEARVELSSRINVCRAALARAHEVKP